MPLAALKVNAVREGAPSVGGGKNASKTRLGTAGRPGSERSMGLPCRMYPLGKGLRPGS